MRRVLHGIGAIFLLLAVLLGLLALVSWPPEGLFFGLPFFFLMPALLFCIRPSKTPTPSEKGGGLP